MLRVLTDNYTYIDEYFLGEPGLSFYIEDEGEKILFDTGYSDVFLKNAEKMNIDLGQVQKIVFSHGHSDHTWGFKYFVKKYDISDMTLVAHPLCFNQKRADGIEIGNMYSEKDVKKLCHTVITREPVKISKHITFLGEIPVTCDFEQRRSLGEYKSDCWQTDYLTEDTALAYDDGDGIFIITGCSHSGICNICEQAKKICGKENIKGIIGGFHMFDLDERLEKTIEYFEKNNINELYPCHCVSFKAKAAINSRIPIHEVGVGMKLEI
ncbi:MAG: MBL fold metallo-hydrolase [Clostridia bacterium]|jgi:7,8-dihydropterin-6-yl-methyl-4-(beta-D-ribofuranosyl)aminobenzene 5'-phosphate synthase|nr:MBL fold metallo-hydrolase [Clostridia bacterium]MCI2001087.1 MBL fold metallo-hydrolase [Clostridia bacterium]MCI2015787.1 MBL fold metallo-hydrolase [Clostridia bacterium]